ncbi:MAG: ribosome-associated translation inhibitor RaiA [Bacteroidia bacterium]|nr:ribosome-associated translation inhibitor RaiA [Bacteroidia bacterium]
MKLQVQSIHFHADQKLLDYVQEKIDKLVHYYDAIIGGEVFLKIDKSSDHQNKVIHVKLHIPGNDIFVAEQASTFEEATDIAVAVLARQIKKHKEKRRRM